MLTSQTDGSLHQHTHETALPIVPQPHFRYTLKMFCLCLWNCAAVPGRMSGEPALVELARSILRETLANRAELLERRRHPAGPNGIEREGELQANLKRFCRGRCLLPHDLEHARCAGLVAQYEHAEVAHKQTVGLAH